jgi:hypothetical protein
MRQNFRYVSELGALLQHAAGQGVAKQMSSDVLGLLDTRLGGARFLKSGRLLQENIFILAIPDNYGVSRS